MFPGGIHRRILTPPVPKRDQLIVEVACWLAREPREIIIVGTLTLNAVASGAGQHPSGHGVGRAFSRLRMRMAKRNDEQSCGKQCQLKTSRRRSDLLLDDPLR